METETFQYLLNSGLSRLLKAKATILSECRAECRSRAEVHRMVQGTPYSRPRLGLGKGWGALNIQNAFSGSLPTSGTGNLGRAFIWNTAVQYRIKGRIWPMIEQNSTFFSDGPNPGKKQIFLTPGIVFGTFRVGQRSGVSMGCGVQIAVTQFHTYDHRWISTVRLPF